MNKILISCLGAISVVSSTQLCAATIDTMYTATFGHYWQSHSAGSQSMMVFSQADYYLLDDGNTWDSGAGWHPDTDSTLSSISISGSTITYTFETPENGILFQNTDYNSGDHSAQGVLGVSGPLEITADLGGTTAFLSGHTEIISNDETWYGEPRFNYYSANVGDLVYFEVNYILGNGAVFDENLFNTDFSYNLTGQVDFTTVVPLPPAILMFGSAVCALFFTAKRKQS